ncbi:Uncharacterized protein Fot_42194 [Forsythia ovata]|uniref:Uncharacterized protein n=1 Tax=Forsythia ovata TaxID=205694 RepID=A0ABD1RLZ3_9LAMI
MVAKVEAFQKELLNFIDFDEGKQIFEDGKQAGGTKLLELIGDEHPDFKFDSSMRKEKQLRLLFHRRMMTVMLSGSQLQRLFISMQQTLLFLKIYKICNRFCLIKKDFSFSSVDSR